MDLHHETAGTVFNKKMISGRLVDILNPTTDDIIFSDIIHALCGITRYDNHTTRPVMLSEHSLYVGHLMRSIAPVGEREEYQRHGLAHDFHEYALGDQTTPVNKAVTHLAGIDGFGMLKARWDSVIFEALGMTPPTDAIIEAVKWCDRQVFIAEYQAYIYDPKPTDIGLEEWPDDIVDLDKMRDSWLHISPHREFARIAVKCFANI